MLAMNVRFVPHSNKENNVLVGVYENSRYDTLGNVCIYIGYWFLSQGRVEGNQDCKYALEVENKDEEKRVVVVRMTMTARYNNGRTGEKLASYHKSLDLGAGEGEYLYHSWKEALQSMVDYNLQT